jgi:hypothetical protein
MSQAAQIASRIRPDGRVALKFPDGTVKLHWPIDARELMATQKDLAFADEPMPARRQPADDEGAKVPMSPRNLAPAPPRLPGGPVLQPAPSQSKGKATSQMPPAPAGGDDFSVG